MARIFVSFYSFCVTNYKRNVFPAFYDSFINGLKEAGNEVYCFFNIDNYQFRGEIPNNILKKVKAFNPDVFIFFNNAFWDITRHFDCPIIIYDVDSPLLFNNKDKIKEHADRYKFITLQDESADNIKQIFNVNDNQIFKGRFFTSIKSDSSEELVRNIAFCGSNWLENKSQFVTRFLSYDYTPQEAEWAKEIYNEYIKYPFVHTNDLYDEKGYKTTNRLFLTDSSCDTSFISGLNRVRYLQAICDLGLDLRGIFWDRKSMKYFPEVGFCYNKEIVFSLEENQKFYNGAKIWFNSNHIQALSSFSLRVCDIMASNACLVTEERANIKKLFPNIGIPTFTNPYEAREQCIKILNNENLRQDIVAKSHELIEKNHRFKNILEVLESCSDIKLLNAENTGSTTYDLYQEKKPSFLSSFIAGIKDLKGFQNSMRYRIWKHFDDICWRKNIID